MKLLATLEVLLLTEIMIVARQPRYSCHHTTMYQFNCGQIYGVIMTACGRNREKLSHFVCLQCSFCKLHYK